MDGWGFITVALTIAVCIILVVVGGKTRLRHWHERDHGDSHVYGFEPQAKLLGTIPSEDHLEHKTVERAFREIGFEEDEEIDLRHQRPSRYRYMDEDEEQQHQFVPNETIEQCISHEIVDNHREEASFALIDDPVVVERLIAEAHDLVRDLNQEFGQEMGEPRIADRLFNTNVLAVLGAAKTSKKIDFRTMKMISVMRTFGRAANGGRNELSKVMAVRTLLGSARLTVKELENIDHARRLFGDDFAEAAGYVDHLSRTEEIVAARRLGIPSKETSQDQQANRSIDIETKGVSRSLDQPTI